MTDFDVIREWLMDEWTTWERENRTPENNQALAALSRVETELAEAQRERDKALLSVEGLSKRLTIAVAAEARVTELTATVVAGIRIASQYLDTDRGDLDGWIESARAALAAPTKEGTP